MCRADRLAGGGAALQDVASCGAVGDIVALCVPGDLTVGPVSVGDVGIDGTALLTELEGVGLAVLHALTAGDALVLVYAGNEVGANCAGGVEHLGDTQSVAGAAAAVADGGGFLKAGGLIYLMHKAVVLGTLEYLVSLFLADEAMLTVLREAYGVVVEVHAHIVLKVTAAFADESAAAAAGAGTDGDGGGVLDKGAELVVGGGPRIVLDSAHDGHNTHEHHAALTVLKHGGDRWDSPAGVFLEAGGEVGVLLALLLHAEDAFHDAGDPNGVVVAGLSVDDPGTDDARLDELFDLFPYEVLGLAAALCKILNGAVCLKTHMEHDLAHRRQR